MPPNRSRRPSPDLTFPILAAAVVLGCGAVWFGYPGVAVVWLAAVAVSWMRPAPELSGKKDQAGRPTAGHPGEAKALRQWRLAGDLKWRLLFPTFELLPGWPVFWSWVVAVACGVVGFVLPVEQQWMRFLNAVAAFWLVAQTAASRRLYASDGGQSPGVRVPHLLVAWRRQPGAVAVPGLVAATVAGAVLWRVGGFGFSVPGSLAAILLVTVAAVWWPMRQVALRDWQELARARTTYEVLWESLKFGTPDLVSRTSVGPATVDRFATPAGKQASDYVKGTSTIAAELARFVGTDSAVHVLYRNAIGPDGNPVPGRTHPGEFEIVTWPDHARVDMSAECDPNTLGLWLRVAFTQWAVSSVAEVVPEVAEAVNVLTHPVDDEADSGDEGAPGEGSGVAGSGFQYAPPPPPPPMARPASTDRRSPAGPRRGVTVAAAVPPPTVSGAGPDGAVDDLFDGFDRGAVVADLFDGPDPGDGDNLAAGRAAAVTVSDTAIPDSVYAEPDRASGSLSHRVSASLARVGHAARGLTRRAAGAAVSLLTSAGRGVRTVGVAAGRAVAHAPTTIAAGWGWVARFFTPTSTDWVGQPDTPAVWQIRFVPGTFNYEAMRKGHRGVLAGILDCDVLIWHRNRPNLPAPAMWCGALNVVDQPNMGGFVWAPDAAQGGLTYKFLDDIATEDTLRSAWEDAIPQGKGIRPPIPEAALRKTATLPAPRGGRPVTLKHEVFMPMAGLAPEAYFPFEDKMASRMGVPLMMSFTSWTGSASRQGEADRRAFEMNWSTDPVPTSPTEVTPPSVGRGDLDACAWVLAWQLNRAFTSVRLARPALLAAEPVTEPGSREHIWRMVLRLQGGNTISDVRNKAGNIASSLGTDWFRVEPAPDGCVIVAGAHHAGVSLARGQEGLNYVTRLDWEQAFQVCGVVGSGGLLPRLVRVGQVEQNPDVQVIDFELPDGLDVKSVRALAKDKLRPATNNEFIDIRAGVDGARSMRVMACVKDPMPTMAAYDWDAVGGAYSPIPFGTLGDGSYEAIDFRAEPHAVIVGGSNSGKTAAAQNLMFGALVRGCDLVVVDVQKQAADFKFAEPWCRTIATTVEDARAALEAVYAEVQRRAQLNSVHGVGSSRDLPDPPPTTLLFIDEFRGLITALRPSQTKEADPELEAARLEQQAIYENKRRIAFLTGRIAAEARSADIHLVLMTQKLSSKTLPPELEDLRTNAARVILGKASYGDLMAALREPDAAPDRGDHVPKGRAIWESTEAQPVQVQFWYASQAEFTRHLDSLGVPHAVPLDLAAYRPKEKAAGGFEVLGGGLEEITPGPDQPPSPVDLDVDLSFDDMSFDDDTDFEAGFDPQGGGVGDVGDLMDFTIEGEPEPPSYDEAVPAGTVEQPDPQPTDDATDDAGDSDPDVFPVPRDHIQEQIRADAVRKAQARRQPASPSLASFSRKPTTPGGSPGRLPVSDTTDQAAQAKADEDLWRHLGG